MQGLSLMPGPLNKTALSASIRCPHRRVLRTSLLHAYRQPRDPELPSCDNCLSTMALQTPLVMLLHSHTCEAQPAAHPVSLCQAVLTFDKAAVRPAVPIQLFKTTEQKHTMLGGHIQSRSQMVATASQECHILHCNNKRRPAADVVVGAAVVELNETYSKQAYSATRPHLAACMHKEQWHMRSEGPGCCQ